MLGQITTTLPSVLVLGLTIHAGCANVTGGAVELSWKLRSASGAADNFVDCDSNGTLTDSMGTALPITQKLVDIRLHWDTQDATRYVDFKCSASHGVTTFQLPPGEAFLWVSPICDDGTTTYDPAPETFSAPAPVQRTVTAGGTISLGAVELVLQVTSCLPDTGSGSGSGAQLCICQMPAS